MDILGPLPKSLNAIHLYWGMISRRSKLVRTVPTPNTMASHTVPIFMACWIISYSIPFPVLAYNGTQFVKKLFETLRRFLGTKHTTTTVYHVHTNGHTEQFKMMIIFTLNTIFQSISKKRTFICSRCCMHVVLKCTALRILGQLAWSNCDISLVRWYSTLRMIYQLTRQRLHLNRHYKHYCYIS